MWIKSSLNFFWLNYWVKDARCVITTNIMLEYTIYSKKPKQVNCMATEYQGKLQKRWWCEKPIYRDLKTANMLFWSRAVCTLCLDFLFPLPWEQWKLLSLSRRLHIYLERHKEPSLHLSEAFHQSLAHWKPGFRQLCRRKSEALCLKWQWWYLQKMCET